MFVGIFFVLINNIYTTRNIQCLDRDMTVVIGRGLEMYGLLQVQDCVESCQVRRHISFFLSLAHLLPYLTFSGACDDKSQYLLPSVESSHRNGHATWETY